MKVRGGGGLQRDRREGRYKKIFGGEGGASTSSTAAGGAGSAGSTSSALQQAAAAPPLHLTHTAALGATFAYGSFGPHAHHHHATPTPGCDASMVAEAHAAELWVCRGQGGYRPPIALATSAAALAAAAASAAAVGMAPGMLAGSPSSSSSSSSSSGLRGGRRTSLSSTTSTASTPWSPQQQQQQQQQQQVVVAKPSTTPASAAPFSLPRPALARDERDYAHPARAEALCRLVSALGIPPLPPPMGRLARGDPLGGLGSSSGPHPTPFAAHMARKALDVSGCAPFSGGGGSGVGGGGMLRAQLQLQQPGAQLVRQVLWEEPVVYAGGRGEAALAAAIVSGDFLSHCAGMVGVGAGGSGGSGSEGRPATEAASVLLNAAVFSALSQGERERVYGTESSSSSSSSPRLAGAAEAAASTAPAPTAGEAKRAQLQRAQSLLAPDWSGAPPPSSSSSTYFSAAASGLASAATASAPGTFLHGTSRMQSSPLLHLALPPPSGEALARPSDTGDGSGYVGSGRASFWAWRVAGRTAGAWRA